MTDTGSNDGNSENRFTYDAHGRLSGVVGEACIFNADCKPGIGPVADPEDRLPRYILQYDSATRLTRSTGDYGDDLQIRYLADGRVGSMASISPPQLYEAGQRCGVLLGFL